MRKEPAEEWKRHASGLGKGSEMVDLVPKRRGDAEACGHGEVEFREGGEQNIKHNWVDLSRGFHSVGLYHMFPRVTFTFSRHLFGHFGLL
jgi:hypothetical protein